MLPLRPLAEPVTLSIYMSPGGSLSGKRILIVEDNYLVAEDLRQIIHGADGEVGQASSTAKDALASLEGERFDGVLLDVQLQDGTCVEVARQLERRHIPFVVVSGYLHEWLAPELQNAPYLAKPFDRDELIALASRHFSSSSSA